MADRLWYMRSTVPGVGQRLEVWLAPDKRVFWWQSAVRFTWNNGVAHVEVSVRVRHARRGAKAFARVVKALKHAGLSNPTPNQVARVLDRLQGSEVYT